MPQATDTPTTTSARPDAAQVFRACDLEPFMRPIEHAASVLCRLVDPETPKGPDTNDTILWAAGFLHDRVEELAAMLHQRKRQWVTDADESERAKMLTPIKGYDDGGEA